MLNQCLCSIKEKNWSNFKSDLLAVEESQLLEFYKRCKKNPALNMDIQKFKKSIDSFLRYYSRV